MKMLIAALLSLSLSACVFEVDDFVPHNGGDSGDTTPDLDETAPEACVVGLWTVTGDTGYGDCYSLVSIIIEDSVLFEQEGDQVYVSLYNGTEDEYVTSAGYDESSNGCSAGFTISVAGPDRFDLHYAVTADSSGTVRGTATLAADIDGYSCEQAWLVVGVVEK